MMPDVPYCGLAPVPADAWQRWNLDPLLIAALAALSLVCAMRSRAALAGCAVAALAWLTPLCALGVALFSARVAQHLLLTLVAAPLLACGLERRAHSGAQIAAACCAFAAVFWIWHAPAPYDATRYSSLVYWASHLSLLGAAVWLWR